MDFHDCIAATTLAMGEPMLGDMFGRLRSEAESSRQSCDSFTGSYVSMQPYSTRADDYSLQMLRYAESSSQTLNSSTRALPFTSGVYDGS